MTIKKFALATAMSAGLVLSAHAVAKKPSITQVPEADAQAVVRILIDSRGNPVEIEMLRSSGDRDTDRTIIHAARTFKIEPQPGEKKPAPGWYVVPAKIAQG